jgi:creatinine amidohydrolase
MVDFGLLKASPPRDGRALVGDGSFGGEWQKDDETMLALWETCVAKTPAPETFAALGQP